LQKCPRSPGIANPLLVLDELDKSASGNYNGRLADVLVPFLETESARQLQDPFVECAVALHYVGYIATSNEVTNVPGPLLDRFRVLNVPQPRRQDLLIVVRTIMSEIRAERLEDEMWCPDLDGDELDLLAKQWRGGSLRPLRRLVETILSGRLAFASRH
jgi:ATP-dependent Lon protease